MDINNLSIDEKIGQRFIVGVNNTNIDIIVDLIKNGYIGGVILYKRNYKNYDDMLKIVKKFKEANKNNKVPLFIAIDQEGGRVNRLPNEIHNLKNIYDVSKKDSSLVADYADIISKILTKSGINMNFAPVLDIYNGSKSKALDKRCFYGNSREISNMAICYIESTKKNGIISVVKHYPGHGATRVDSHFLIPFEFNYREVLNKHIVPFNRLIENGADAMMVGHMCIRKLTGFLPASLSNKFINNHLDNYNGLLISDEVNMLKRHLIYRINFYNKIINSPCDFILIKIKDLSEGYKLINKFKNSIVNDIQYEKILDRHVTRVLDIKKKYNINDNISFDGIDVDEINREIDLLNSKI